MTYPWDSVAALGTSLYDLSEARVPNSVLDVLEVLAADDRTQVSQEARNAVRQALRHREQPLVLWQVLLPPLLGATEHEDPGVRRDVAIAFGRYLLTDDAPLAVLVSLVQSLDDVLLVACSAADALLLTAYTQRDLRPIMAQLQAALDHPEWHVRWQVSRTVSLALRDQGIEPLLRPHDKLVTNAWWTPTVWHRRTYAADDEATFSPELPRDIRPSVDIRCGFCLSDDVRWLFSGDDSGAIWTGHLVEVGCDYCGKYTCWAYDDS